MFSGDTNKGQRLRVLKGGKHGEVRMVLILEFKQLLNTKVCYNMLLKLL